MATRHLILARESVLGTYVAPSLAYPVVSAAIDGDQDLLENPSTGLFGRAQGSREPGTFAAGGPFEMLLYPTLVGNLLRSVCGTRAKVAAGALGFKNKLLPDDEAAFDSFSAQSRYSALMAKSARGLKIGSAKIAARVNEYARFSGDFVGMDAAITGGTWLDGTSAPAVIDPVPYPATLPKAFHFARGVARLGGSVALTSGEIVVTGGTARSDFDDIEVDWDFGLSEDGYGVNLGNRGRQTIDEGERAVSCRFSPNFAKVASNGAEFWLAWKDGLAAVFELYFRSDVEYETGFKHELKITLPQIKYTSGALPEVARQYGLQRVSVEAEAEAHDTIGVDFGITLQTTVDLTV